MALKFVIMPPQNGRTRAWAAQMMDSIPDYTVVAPETEEEAARELPGADAAFGTIPPALLGQATDLKWLQAPAAAPNAGYYYDELVDHPVQITNFREIYNDHISMFIMAFVLMFARGFHVYFPNQMRRDWDATDPGTTYLPEATAVIIGVGGIGSEAARHCAHFGMRVIGVDARREDVPEGVATIVRPDDLDSVLPEADFVIMTIPHTPQTEGLMGAEKFMLMKKSAFLINIGRGMTVQLDALVDALRKGEIAGAGLDVYEQEPLPADHPLWGMPNVILTPHTAAYGPYLDDRRTEVLMDNARRFAEGKPLRNLVDKANWF
jgi:phosphoglycerate dehydrogenase-like enzyme